MGEIRDWKQPKFLIFQDISLSYVHLYTRVQALLPHFLWSYADFLVAMKSEKLSAIFFKNPRLYFGPPDEKACLINERSQSVHWTSWLNVWTLQSTLNSINQTKSVWANCAENNELAILSFYR